jgi:hypothetical protein
MPATRAKMSSRGHTLFPMAALAPNLSTVDRTPRVVCGPRKSRPDDRTDLIGPEARIAGPTRTKSPAKSGHWQAGIAYVYHRILPAKRHVATVRCTRLKIVVSPVRVRVSPSAAPWHPCRDRGRRLDGSSPGLAISRPSFGWRRGSSQAVSSIQGSSTSSPSPA